MALTSLDFVRQRALKLKSMEADVSISALVNQAVRDALKEFAPVTRFRSPPPG